DPGQLLPVDHLEEECLDRRAVLGVNPFEPPGRVRLAVVMVVAEERENAFVPPDLVRPQVPVPDRVVRRLRQGTEPPLAGPQLLLGPFEIGDVSGGADEANGVSLRVAQHRAARKMPAGPTVLGPHPILVIPFLSIATK